MKTLMTTLMLVCSLGLMAQSARYEGAMKKQMALLDSARTPEQFQQLANDFERIATAEKTMWQPAYYSAYALIMKAYYSPDTKDTDALCDKADGMLAMAESLSPANSELTTLRAMALTARMRVDGSRGMTMGPQATALCQKALGQQPANNPRALAQMAQMLYYTPAAFGGGKEPGVAYLKKAVAAYDGFVPATPFDPTWGKPYYSKLLEEWSK